MSESGTPEAILSRERVQWAIGAGRVDLIAASHEALRAEVERLTAALRKVYEWRDEYQANTAVVVERLTAERDALTSSLAYWKNLLTTRTTTLRERAERAERDVEVAQRNWTASDIAARAAEARVAALIALRSPASDT